MQNVKPIRARTVGSAGSAERVRRKRAAPLLLLGGLFLAAVLAAFGIPLIRRAGAESSPAALAELLKQPPEDLTKVPIARMNLLCASGPGMAEKTALKECLATISLWAQRVQFETDRHRYRYDRNPAQFENSPGFFCMLMLAVVLAEDYGIHYADSRKSEPAAAAASDGFFSNPRDVFLHGLLGPARQGTCSSLPVLYVAVGRELGYPLKLVTTKAHLFVRWDGAGERFNVEAAGVHGLNRFADDYYRHWPFELRPGEEAAEGYLKSLSPPEELAVFLSIRAMCLRESGRLADAAEAFATAARLSPGTRSYRLMAGALRHKLAPTRAAASSGSAQPDTSHLKPVAPQSAPQPEIATTTP